LHGDVGEEIVMVGVSFSPVLEGADSLNNRGS
jgi:hypothetical protein